MIELHIIVEGATEESFVKSVLTPHLEARDVWTRVAQVGTKRERDGRKHRGGGDWDKWKADILRRCADKRPEVRISTLFDLYGLPGNFPGLSACNGIADTRRRCDALEAQMAATINDPRFIAYLQRHEFEALVLAALSELDQLLSEPRDRAGLAALQREIGDFGPEDINDGATTAPSKRLQAMIPSYSPRDGAKGEGKSLYGPLVTEAFGLAALRAKCPRFDVWVTKLENL